MKTGAGTATMDLALGINSETLAVPRPRRAFSLGRWSQIESYDASTRIDLAPKRLMPSRNLWLAEQHSSGSAPQNVEDFVGQRVRLRSPMIAEWATRSTGPAVVRPIGLVVEDALVLFEPSDDIRAAIPALLNRFRTESLGDEGAGPGLLADLSSLLGMGGSGVIALLDDALKNSNSDEIAGETLRWIGAVNHPQSWAPRRTMLESNLRSSSPRVRYVAAVGLAKMDDPTSIPVLTAALRNETHDGVRYHLRKVLDQLIDTRRCLA